MVTTIQGAKVLILSVFLLVSTMVIRNVQSSEQVTTNLHVKNQASQLLSRIGIERGIVVLLDSEPAELAVALAQKSELTVYVQLPSRTATQIARQRIDAAGLLGTRVYVEHGDWSHLHLANNLADAVVVTAEAVDNVRSLKPQLLRVLRPLGKLLLGTDTQTKPYPRGADDWTHPYHGPDNNPLSRDHLARFPYLTQFLAEPYYVPFPEVTVTSTGRVFKAFGHIAFKPREWPWLNTLVALNGYNGTLLWKRDLEPGYIIHRNTMIATPEVLYVGDGTSCKVIDVVTGELLYEITAPPGATGRAWKWMAIEDGILYALLGEEEPHAEVQRGALERPGWPWGPWKGFRIEQDQTGFGRTLSALDLKSKQWLWTHHETDPIDGRALCMKSGRVFGYSHLRFLVCIEAKSGSVLWRNSDPDLLAAIGQLDKAQHPARGFFTSAFMKCNDDGIFFAGPQLNHLVAASTENGRLLWKYDPTGNFQLVLREDGLYALGYSENSKKFDPLTGDVLADLGFARQACTRATGSIDTIFCRAQPSGTVRLSVEDNRVRRFGLMRPACHDGVLAAGGQMYWGPWMCDCNLQLVGFVSLSPAGDFEFESEATEAERLVAEPEAGTFAASLAEAPGDWAAYRADSRRSGASNVDIPLEITEAWRTQLPPNVRPNAPISAGGVVYLSSSDGIVRALNASDGSVRWKQYTGGSIAYPPAVEGGRLFVGSGDGWIYAVDASTGMRLWQFRAAPAPRKISVHGRLVSTWPVGSGVLVDRDVVYAAAGLASHDGTHVYALDAATGKIHWQNNSSGRLAGTDSTNGVSVQGHLLLHEDRLYLAGGNMVSPAIYNIENGHCLSTLEDESTKKAPRGRDLFLVDGEVGVFNKLMYGEHDYMRKHRFQFVQAENAEVLIRGFGGRLVRIERGSDLDEKVNGLWESKQLKQISSLALGRNAVVVAGQLASVSDDSTAGYAVLALSIQDGQIIWSHVISAKPVNSAIALDAGGRIHVATEEGDIVCLIEASGVRLSTGGAAERTD